MRPFRGTCTGATRAAGRLSASPCMLRSYSCVGMSGPTKKRPPEGSRTRGPPDRVYAALYSFLTVSVSENPLLFISRSMAQQKRRCWSMVSAGGP